jgi:hypothetical protein
MAITIKGIRLESVELQRQDSTEKIELRNASYSLLSSADHVLANQTIGGYNDKLKIRTSAETNKLLNSFLDSYRKDITQMLGLEEV